MGKLSILIIAVSLVIPAAAAPTYWDFTGDVYVSTIAGTGSTLSGQFWGDADTDELWGFSWTSGSAGYQTDFIGWTIQEVQDDYIVAYADGGNNTIVFDPLPGGDYYMQVVNQSGYLQVKPLDVTMRSAPAPVPAPGAILLGGMGMSLVGWLRRKKQL